ncbi:hypothetical protein [Amycolatopsis tolypomycina]|uniref:Uncharacterized protein n=1 Tax=Amycolatopsis tolypomycina TaxID=208445 RepID=A0A1H4UJD5_9PSEU|nr:hypothetical protein [Amycolatopsis tolypomycina]SEC68518.1 hypothetical protein SAMN04489727_4686 [Amycolatopsis tolypomycina]
MTADPPLEPAPGPPARRPLLARPAVTGLAGFVAGAVLVGVPWLVLTLLAGPSGGPLTAPPTLGGLSRAQDAIAKLDKAKGQATIDRIGKSDKEDTARVSAAYGGAGAVVQQYQDDRLRRSVRLLAVRAPSPGLIAPYQDAEALGLAAPGTELVRFGDVQCLVHHDPENAGSAPDPERSSVRVCQHTGPDLTVTLQSISSEGNRDPREFAGILEEAWTILSR